MAQKRVSFEVAQVIKILGFHEATAYYYGDGYDDEDNPVHEFILCATCIPAWVHDWNNIEKHPEYDKTHIDYWRNVWSAPTYIDVWLWLWREKKIKIKPIDNFATYIQGFEDEIQLEGVEDPEDAIIAAVEHLCKNDLIK